MNYAYQSSSDDSRALPLNAQYGSIPQKAFLRSSLVLPSPAKLDTKGKYSFDEEALKAIKSELYKGHGVSLAINVSHNGFIQDNMASYYDGNNAADHAVTVVGYDDDYPNATFNGFAKRLRPITDEILPEYAAYFFRSYCCRAQCMSMASLITRASLNDGMIERLKIRYPESKKIQSIIAFFLMRYD